MLIINVQAYWQCWTVCTIARNTWLCINAQSRLILPVCFWNFGLLVGFWAAPCRELYRWLACFIHVPTMPWADRRIIATFIDVAAPWWIVPVSLGHALPYPLCRCFTVRPKSSKNLLSYLLSDNRLLSSRMHIAHLFPDLCGHTSPVGWNEISLQLVSTHLFPPCCCILAQFVCCYTHE